MMSQSLTPYTYRVIPFSYLIFNNNYNNLLNFPIYHKRIPFNSKLDELTQTLILGSIWD